MTKILIAFAIGILVGGLRFASPTVAQAPATAAPTLSEMHASIPRSATVETPAPTF